MANPLANPSVTAAFGAAGTIANAIGLNNWQLYQGSYNGVKFHLIVAGALDNLNRFNPAAGITTKVEGLLTRASQVGANITPPDNTKLPYGTSTVAKNVNDAGSKKYARHTIPNANYNVLEDMGWNGETIRVVGIIFGSSSLDANNNLFNVIINPTSVSPTNRNVLVHPVLGTINNVFLTSYRRIHSSDAYKAIAYEFVFETSSPVQSQALAKTSLSQLASVFNTVTSVYSAINQSVTLATILFTAGKNYINSLFQANYNNVKIAAAQFVGITRILYTNLAPSGFVSPSLEALNPTTVNLSIGNPTASVTSAPASSIPSSNSANIASASGIVSVNLSAYNSAFSTGLPNGVTQVVTLYAQSIQNVINLIYESGQGSSFQSAIANLESSVVALTNVGQTLLSNYFNNTTTVTVQNNTTLEEILFQNNIDFNTASNIQQVITLNTGKFNSFNFIPAGTEIILPNDLSG